MKDVYKIDTVEQIPFLPIEFFKTHRIVSTAKKEDIVFSSSGTTGIQTSKHYVADLGLYEESFFRSFRRFVGDPEDLPYFHCCRPIKKGEALRSYI